MYRVFLYVTYMQKMPRQLTNMEQALKTIYWDTPGLFDDEISGFFLTKTNNANGPYVVAIFK